MHDTPADVYSNTTKYLGFKRLRDEGKVMGLSASGKPIYVEYFKFILNLRMVGLNLNLVHKIKVFLKNYITISIFYLELITIIYKLTI